VKSGKKRNVPPDQELPSPSVPVVTLADVAKKVGVSSTTVSLALRNHPRISQDRRKEIQALAERMGYRPNALATNLAYHRHASSNRPTEAALAWINAYPDPKELLSHQQFAAYWKGASTAAEKFGYRLDEFVVGKEMPMRRIGKILRARNINGILIPPHAGMDVPWKEMDWSDFAVVRFGLTAKDLPPFHAVTADQAGNAYLAFMKMKELGYKRIGFAGAIEKEWRGLAGFAQAQFTVPPEQRVPPLLHHFREGRENLQKPLRYLEEQKPDAILIEHGEFFDQLMTLGITAPKDVGLATTVLPDVPLDSGIDQNPEEIGRVAVLLLLSQIRDNSRGIPPILRQSLVSGTWKQGKSLAKKAKRSG